ncbi:sulfotransferase 1E1-like [Drosophila busckii]|uniref:sulfotransferase 1E1-like n=1 Tax=Drosophila busckii TaxID=30019 RepID=UPI00083EA4BB|nr:sulfotransferase 1E1-like [Drosophila busckii]
MFVSRSIETSADVPMMRLGRTGDQSICDWIPLEQDWSQRWCTLPTRFIDYKERIDEFETLDGDVYVVSYMKSGNTWLLRLVWMMCNNLDFEMAKSNYLVSPRMEYLDTKSSVDSIDNCKELNRPRVIKSHLPPQLLPHRIWQQAHKYIYIARNPKDVIVSSYSFLTSIGLYLGDLDNFVDDFLNDKVLYTSYWTHVIDNWRMRNEPNIFFVTYEDMQRDFKAVIVNLIKFLELPSLTSIEIDKLIKHLSFENIRAGKYTNPTQLIKDFEKSTKDFNFMRRGIVGSYKDELTALQIDMIDKWTADFLKQYELQETDIFGQL